MSDQESSADVLREIWERFAHAAEQESGAVLSMRLVSEHYLHRDEGLLGRWTKPGTRKNWRIPFGQIERTARELKATADQVDRLFMARLREAEADRTDHDATAATAWTVGVLERSLSPDEELVLSTYRSARAGFPAGLSRSEAESAQLRDTFDGLLAAAQDPPPDDLHAGQLTPEEWQSMVQRRDAMLPRLKAYFEDKRRESDKARKALRRKTGETVAKQAREYIEGLRKQR